MREEREFTLPNADMKPPFIDLARFGRIGRGCGVGEREGPSDPCLGEGNREGKEKAVGAGAISQSTASCQLAPCSNSTAPNAVASLDNSTAP